MISIDIMPFDPDWGAVGIEDWATYFLEEPEPVYPIICTVVNASAALDITVELVTCTVVQTWS